MAKPVLRFERSKKPKVALCQTITRRWVETADESCPLACVWFALREPLDNQDDESGIFGLPSIFPPGRQAFCTAFIFFGHP